MIERHITFTVDPAKTDDFTRFFEDRYRAAMTDVDGYVSARLLQHAEDDSNLLMVLQFDDVEASAAWRNSDVHEDLQGDLKELHSGMDVQGYESI